MRKYQTEKQGNSTSFALRERVWREQDGNYN
jgi:hypothetical protein